MFQALCKYVPGMVLSTVHGLAHLILLTILSTRYDPQFLRGRETEVTGPGLHMQCSHSGLTRFKSQVLGPYAINVAEWKCRPKSNVDTC